MALKLKIGLLYSLCLLKMPFKLDKKLMAVKSIKKIKDLLRNTCQSIALKILFLFWLMKNDWFLGNEFNSCDL